MLSCKNAIKKHFTPSPSRMKQVSPVCHEPQKVQPSLQEIYNLKPDCSFIICFFIVSLNLRTPRWRPRSQLPLGLCKQNKAVMGIIQACSTVQAVENTAIFQSHSYMLFSCGIDIYGQGTSEMHRVPPIPFCSPGHLLAPNAVGAALGWCEGTSVTMKSTQLGGIVALNMQWETWWKLVPEHLIMEMGNGVRVLALCPDKASVCQPPHSVGTVCFLGIQKMCRKNFREGFDFVWRIFTKYLSFTEVITDAE